MAKPWDEAMKNVIMASPQEFVEWVLPEGRFIELVLTELPKETEEPLRSDICLAIDWESEPWILLVEVQSSPKPRMAERLLEYSLRVKRIDPQHRPVYACVLYLRKVGDVPRPPCIWERPPKKRELLRYDYGCIELAELEPEMLLATQHAGLLPLLPLTKGGASHQVTETMFSELKAAGRTELVTVGTVLASLALGKENTTEQDWLTRKVNEMFDLIEETPIFQQWTKHAREEGLEMGREEGLKEGLEKGLEKAQEGKLEVLRETILALVQTRFSNARLKRQAKGQVAIINDPAVLQGLIVKVSVAQSAEEAQNYLLEWPATDEEN